MAPKAAKAPVAKRARETPAAAQAKKAKVVLEQVEEAVVDPVKAAVAAVQEALEGAELSEDCRNMLAALAPGCLCTFATERQEPQKMAVRMIGETLAARRKALEQAVAIEEATLAEVEGSRNTRGTKVTEAEAALADVAAEIEARTQVLAEASQAMVEAKAAVDAAVDKQTAGDGALVAAGGEKKAIEDALVNDFRPLKNGTCEAGQENTHVGVLLPLVMTMGLDESLATALPSSCAKQPSERGPFDNMVVDQLELLMGEKVEELAKLLAAAEPSSLERAAVVEAANKAADEAKESQRQAASRLQEVKSAQRDAVTAQEEAKAAVVTFEPEHRQATEAVAEKKAALALFDSVNMASFEMLRDKDAVTVKKTVAHKVEAEVVSDVQTMEVCNEKVQAAAMIDTPQLAIGGQ